MRERNHNPRVGGSSPSSGISFSSHPEGEAVKEGEEPQAEARELPVGLTGFDVMNYSLAAMQTLVNRYRLAGSPPDILVTIPVTDVRTLEFHRAESMIALGRTATAEALGEAGLGSGAS